VPDAIRTGFPKHDPNQYKLLPASDSRINAESPVATVSSEEEPLVAVILYRRAVWVVEIPAIAPVISLNEVSEKLRRARRTIMPEDAPDTDQHVPPHLSSEDDPVIDYRGRRKSAVAEDLSREMSATILAPVVSATEDTSRLRRRHRACVSYDPANLDQCVVSRSSPDDDPIVDYKKRRRSIATEDLHGKASETTSVFEKETASGSKASNSRRRGGGRRTEHVGIPPKNNPSTSRRKRN
jgi:hypothetical protein